MKIIMNRKAGFCMALLIVTFAVSIYVHAGVLPAPVYKYQLEPYEAWNGIINNNCGPAVNAMIINYFLGIDLSTAINSSPPEAQAIGCRTQARWAYCMANGLFGGYTNTDGEYNGSNRMVTVLNHVGLQTQVVTGSSVTLQRMEQAIDRGSLVICHVHAGYYKVGGYYTHFVLAYGYTADSIVINDPGYQTLHNYYISRADFQAALENANNGNDKLLIEVFTSTIAKY